MFAVNEVANLILGVSAIQLATGLANGLAQYAGSGMTVITVDAGTLGAGVGTGVGVILPPPVLLGTLIASFAGAGILGPFQIPTCNAISLGMSMALAQAIIQTVHAGVGVGSGVVKVIPNSGASIPTFIGAFAAAGMVGVAAVTMATAVASGLDAALPSATGVVVIAGPPNIVPGGGAGTGKLL
jgi:hypothetical protein